MEFAVVNAKWLDDETGELDRRNVLVKNGQIVGMGYIPDEDEASLNVIDANGGLIKTHGFDFCPTPPLDKLNHYVELFLQHGIDQLMLTPSSELPLTSPEQIESLIASIHSPNSIKLLHRRQIFWKMVLLI